jgi:hypothetical protein
LAQPPRASRQEVDASRLGLRLLCQRLVLEPLRLIEGGYVRSWPFATGDILTSGRRFRAHQDCRATRAVAILRCSHKRLMSLVLRDGRLRQPASPVLIIEPI